ncbi:MAG: four-carbon acid sugar kinase family protein [Lachnospiraceae bacterium]|nr:four-carbon acid sugar kinase family protein [Lachnospiraceae bacterium]
MNTKLLIVADDLTGGLDSGVQLAKQGISVCVDPDACVRETLTEVNAQVLVAVCETRHLTPDDAYKAVYRAVSLGKQAGIEYVYKKTDSALRGNIGAELGAALDAGGAATLAFLPAYPAMNRLTINGCQFIDGLPVSQSVFGSDPFNPVKESDIKKLIGQQTEIPVIKKCEADFSPGNRDVDSEALRRILLMDARSDRELRKAGLKLKRAGALSVSAGCAGFAAFLPELLDLKKEAPSEMPDIKNSMLVISGSLNPVTLRQLDYAEKKGFRRIRPEALPENLCGKKKGLSFNDKWMMIDSSGIKNHTPACSPCHSDRHSDPDRGVSTYLAQMFSEAEKIFDGTIMIIGGDTLSACMRSIGCRELRPVKELFPGVVLSSYISEGRKKQLISKSGGFGDEELLIRLRHLMDTAFRKDTGARRHKE